MRHILIILSIFLLTFPSAVYSAQNRVALVIGNGAYKEGPLRNPVNDARILKNVLMRAGFQVSLLENGNKRQMIEAVKNFGKKLRKSDVALFYFSGHGSQYMDRNWIFPIGIDIGRAQDLEFETVSAQRILREMEGGTNKRVNIVIIDACRKTPTFQGYRSASRGLAAPKIQPEGTIYAFSTAPGTIAYDGDGQNSPYVMELKKHLLTPGLKIEDVFKRVRVGVKNRTSRKPTPQIPWENSSLMGDFYFVPQTDGTVISSTSSQNTELVQPNVYNADEEAWNEIRNSSNPEDFKAFIRHFADSPLADTAKFKLDRLKKEQTDRVESVTNLKLSDGNIYTGEFKNNYPNGKGTLIFGPGQWEGHKYVGQFKDGYFHGQGTYIYSDGGKYEGNYKNGNMQDGQGRFTYPDGSVYVGNYIDGQQTGQGTLIIGPGQWHGDKYEGQFKNGQFHGQGTYTYSSGYIDRGEFRDSKLHGEATQIMGPGKWYGDRFFGNFKNGQRQGFGTYSFLDGRKNIGEYKNDKEWNVKHYNIYGGYAGQWVNGVWRSQ